MELETVHGTDWYEMDMRQYDPAIARWTAIDPVTHHSQSTYTGFDNNPVFWADPSGAAVEWVGDFGPSRTESAAMKHAQTLFGTSVSSGSGEGVSSGSGSDSAASSSSQSTVACCDFGSVFGNFITRLVSARAGFLDVNGLDSDPEGLTNDQMDRIDIVRGNAQAVQTAIVQESTDKLEATLDYGSMILPTGPGVVNGLVGMFKRVVGWFAKKAVEKAVKKGVSVSAKNMVLTTAEKAAIKNATGYSRSRIVNGVGIIDNFGMYNKTSHTQLKLITDAFKRNGATSIKVYTNSANDAMRKILNSRIKSGRKLFGLFDVIKRKGIGYIIKGKL